MAPIITHAFASREIWPGETWKIYLNAVDPEGNMKAISCIIDQPGRGIYPAGITRIPEDQRRMLSGYLYLNTAGVEGLNFMSLILKVQIENRAKNLSEPVTFSLAFNPRATQETPPPGIFQDKELGPILITLGSGAGGP